jgi:Fis family transcriptional regulator
MSLDPHPVAQHMAGGFAVAQPKKNESLRDAVHAALMQYFEQLDGTPPSELHQMVMQQVERPLFETVMRYAGGNQSKAAVMLGISRSTLRKKLAQYEIE